MDFEKKLAELFIDLPELPKAAAAVVPSVVVGKTIYLGGQFPFIAGKVSFKGRLGVEVSLDQGKLAARHALLMALSALRQELGSLNKVQKIIQLTGFIAAGGDFQDHDRVLDGASDLLEKIFGATGKHTRIAVGVNSLPKGACVQLALLAVTK